MKQHLLQLPFQGLSIPTGAQAGGRTRLFSTLLLMFALVLTPLQMNLQAALDTAGLAAQPPAVPSQPPAANSLPLAFVPNAGQNQPGVLYQALTPHGLVSFNAQGAAFDLADNTLNLTFQGANTQVQVSGAQRLPGTVNYYQGSDPAAWKTGLPSFSEIRYHELYPGITLSYASANGLLKSTYTLAPGANPALIRWSYSGAQSVQVEAATGSLVVALPGSDSRLVEQAPIAWQTIGSRQVAVSAAYQVSPQGEVSFQLGSFDPSLPLVIDPVLSFSTYMAGNQIDVATAVAADTQGNVYVGGYTRSTTFMGVPGATGTEDVWIAKLNPQGTALLYLTYLTGNDTERPSDMVVDGSGNLYIGGYTSSNNFPTLNPAQANNAGGWDFFVTRLNNAGQIAYSTYLGTQMTEFPEAIALGPDNGVHIAGQISGKGGLFKLAPNGSLLYGVVFGGSGFGETNAKGLAVNQDGEVYMTGTTTHKDLDTVPDSMQTLCDGVEDEFRGCRGDAYILKLNNAQDLAGLQILYNTYFGGISIENVEDMALGSDGSVYLVGQTISNNFPTTTNAVEKTCPSGIDATNTDQCTNFEVFFTHISPSLTEVLYSTYLGGDWKETATAVGIDESGAAYIAGWTEGNDWPLVEELQGHSGGICHTFSNIPRFCIDSFIVKFDDAGSMVYSTYLGGTIDDDFIYEIAVEANGTATVVGSTLSAAFPTTPGTVQSNLPFPGLNGFASKIGTGSTPPPPPPSCFTLTLTKDGSGGTPTAAPGSSTGCSAGSYKAGEVIQLTASPAAGWHVAGWSGADNNGAVNVTQITMPAANHTVRVNYLADNQPGFENFTFLPYIGN